MIKKDISGRNYDKIVIFEDIYICLAFLFFPKLRKKTILWLWNTVTDHQSKYLNVLKIFFKVWSFDDKDVEKYKLHRNEQFYFFDTQKIKKIISNQRIMFVGADKGRFEFVSSLYHFCKKMNYDMFFYVVKDKNVKYPPEYASILFDNYISYNQILDEIDNSTVVVDLTKPNQYGYTVRAMEALAKGKKIITNNVKFEKDFFYNENCILVLEQFDEEKIMHFLENEFAEYDDNVRDYFDYNSWIARFE